VSQSASLALMRELASLNRRLSDHILPTIEHEHEASKGLAVGSMAGKGRELITEAQVRRYILDPLFNWIGWTVDAPARLLVEAPVELPAAAAHRRFLDYHGREVSADGAETSLLIVEAKRLSVELPSQASAGTKAAAGVADTLRELHAGKPRATNTTWKKIVSSLADYVCRVSAANGGSPKRVLLTNGSWFLVFLCPKKTLVDKIIEDSEILVFIDLEDAEHRAIELYSALSYQVLCDHVPPQHCADLYRFLKEEDCVLDVCVSVEISTGTVPDRQPVFAMGMVVQVRVPGAGWIQFSASGNGQDRILVDHRSDRIEHCMSELEEQLGVLLDRIGQQAKFKLTSASDFEEDRKHNRISPKWPDTILLNRITKDLYLLHLGDQLRPLVPSSDYDDCKFHSFGPCHADGVAVGESPLLRQSTNPAAYFPSGSPFHCAHKVVHSIRENRCPLQVLDEFLCCRRCSLQARCWPVGFDQFPCIVRTDPA